MTEERKILMADRKEAAQIVYGQLREMQRATFDVSQQYGRWLLSSLVVIHGGALFGLFTFLGEIANKPAALAQYQYTIWWFVIGLILALFAGLMAWVNWSMHTNNYNHMASYEMLWDPDKWTGTPPHNRGLFVTNWASLGSGLLSAGCIIGGAYSTLNSAWISKILETAIA